ncbi:flavodoxin [Eubacterium sp. An11]|uniref:flavodoxin n=1 Tax=Eubacterium sp. An11 TaxID=1965542 RepID=UPI001FA81C1B|nr:flavodoxin [Eubacterium sp. An11]
MNKNETIKKGTINMKKLTALFLSLAMVLSLAACGTNASNETSAAPESTGNTEEPSSQPETEGEAGGTLVVYYSATGNTEQVANYIANITGGDLFELEPVEPYTSDDLDWTNDNSRVSQEYYDESLRDVELVADTVENWDSYDTIFIGYPIWWGIAAWPTDGFVEANDFTGKTVIPFCTSSSSGLGESGQLLAELAGTGDWQEGMRFRSSASEADVQEWLDSLNLS